MMHVYNPRTQKVEARGLPRVWGQYEPPSEFKASMHYKVRLSQKQKQTHKKQNNCDKNNLYE